MPCKVKHLQVEGLGPGALWRSLGAILTYYVVKSWPYFSPYCVSLLHNASSNLHPQTLDVSPTVLCIGCMQWLFSDIACFQDPHSYCIFKSILLPILFCLFNSDRSSLSCCLLGCGNIWFSVLVGQQVFQICQSQTGVSKYVFLEGLKSFHNFSGSGPSYSSFTMRCWCSNF